MSFRRFADIATAFSRFIVSDWFRDTTTYIGIETLLALALREFYVASRFTSFRPTLRPAGDSRLARLRRHRFF